MTGIVFARFSRPTAALLFSDVAVVGPYQGVTGFMFRITNARSNQLMELEAKVLFSRLDARGRRYDQLKLERTRVVFFPLSWTIVHPITEDSPLWGCTHEDLIEQDAEFLILMSGIDETFAQVGPRALELQAGRDRVRPEVRQHLQPRAGRRHDHDRRVTTERDGGSADRGRHEHVHPDASATRDTSPASRLRDRRGSRATGSAERVLA